MEFQISEGPAGVDQCDESALPSFTVQPRDMALRVAVIANLSKRPIAVDAVLGEMLQSSDWRVADSNRLSPSAGAPIDIGTRSIPPGSSIVIPLQIKFPAPGYLDNAAINASNAWFAKLGTNDLKADTSVYSLPLHPDYAYGPEIMLGGLRVEGSDIEFASRSTNFIEVVAAYETGSCPYLLAWDEVDREWVEHGKILHKAKGRGNEATESSKFNGFQSRFRIEEREPELASIDEAELILFLKNGETHALKLEQASLSARDENYLHLYWGDGIEIQFKLPEGVRTDDVLESHLRVTGFYQRYSDHGPASAADDRGDRLATNLFRKVKSKTSDRDQQKACPFPPLPQPASAR
jgi:hypothetical protein